MFDYYYDLYVGESVKDVAFIKNMLDSGNSVYNIYLLCVGSNGNNLMEIIHSPQLFKRFYVKKRYTIVGIADGRQDSKKLLVKILEDFMNKGRNLQNFKSNFLRTCGQ